jgi:hypothetical protein
MYEPISPEPFLPLYYPPMNTPPQMNNTAAYTAEQAGIQTVYDEIVQLAEGMYAVCPPYIVCRRNDGRL